MQSESEPQVSPVGLSCARRVLTWYRQEYPHICTTTTTIYRIAPLFYLTHLPPCISSSHPNLLSMFHCSSCYAPPPPRVSRPSLMTL